MPLLRPLRRAAALAVAALAPIACTGASDAAPASESATATTTTTATTAAAPADAAPATTPAAVPAGAPQLTVYKSPTCGCCQAWVEHMREHGFAVAVVDTNDLNPIKARHGVAREHESCHTGIVDGYVIEGHVPADLVARLLTERPDIKGLAVPGMPMGSPGMEGPMKEAYDVLAVAKDGRTTVYARR